MTLRLACLVLVLCLELAERTKRLAPLAAAGSMALTIYTAHVLVMAWDITIGGWPMSGPPGADAVSALASTRTSDADIPDMPWLPTGGHRPEGVVGLVCTYLPEIFLVTSVVFATKWRRAIGRGPLEWVLSQVSRRSAERLATTGSPPRLEEQR